MYEEKIKIKKNNHNNKTVHIGKSSTRKALTALKIIKVTSNKPSSSTSAASQKLTNLLVPQINTSLIHFDNRDVPVVPTKGLHKIKE